MSMAVYMLSLCNVWYPEWQHKCDVTYSTWQVLLGKLSQPVLMWWYVNLSVVFFICFIVLLEGVVLVLGICARISQPTGTLIPCTSSRQWASGYCSSATDQGTISLTFLQAHEPNFVFNPVSFIFVRGPVDIVSSGMHWHFSILKTLLKFTSGFCLMMAFC